MFIKLGEDIEISRIENAESCIPAVSQDVLDNFKKTANTLKKIAPKAEDFLYFSAVMMHAAEASGLNEDGTPKLNAKGQPVQVGWDKAGGTWRWQTNDPSIKPYKNSNGDIFPEEELVKAYKKWVHKPLCIDHKSSSVDHVRGFIVDTYYDRNLKRVIALCALDKHNYPDLARKVATGYSNCVSMGTAVGRAICSDCARVAKAEPDFCDHMRKKTCYGEINIDLNPIELSIVVNGADPKAHIKHIIAAANTLNTYVENKFNEINKLADANFSASFTVRTDEQKDLPNGGTANFSVEATDLDSLKEAVNNIYSELEHFNTQLQDLTKLQDSEKDGNDLASEEGSLADVASQSGSSDSELAPPHERFASSSEEFKNSIKELRQVTATIETKLAMMKDNLNNLINKQEENMSGSKEMNKKGYYQGGGGVNEPTPGQVKYPKDPTNEKMRLEGDKQMLGQDPFPGVGDVDGLHPGVESSGVSELERKKMLARAEAEERALRRNAIVNLAKQALEDKKAYFQGGGGVNEPAPGKVKYPADPMQVDVRNNEDKQMVGQKPFPGVGDVEGLHPSPGSAEPSDELKRKQLLSRAALRARFVKAANNDGSQNIGKSAWEVFMGDKLVVSASVNELSGGNSVMLYDSIATKEFGSKLIEKVKAFGASGVRALVKQAQDKDPAAPEAAPAPAAAPAAPAAPEAAPMPAAEEGAGPLDLSLEEGKDKNEESPQATVKRISKELEGLVSDLNEAAKALTEEKKEMGAIEAPAGEELATSASFSLGTLNNLRKELNGSLTHAMKESIAELRDHHQELKMIESMYNSKAINNSNAEFANAIVEDAIEDAMTATADGIKLMSAFVKYARGTQAIVKRAQAEAFMADDSNHSHFADLADSSHADIEDENMDDDLDARLSALEDSSDDSDADMDLDMDSDDDNDAEAHTMSVSDMNNGKPMPKMQAGDTLAVTAAGLNSRAARTALRAKLAADALGKMDDGEVMDMSKAQFSDMLEQSHGVLSDDLSLDMDASDDLSEFDTLESRNRRMMDVATAPVKVRKEAEAIHKLISEGKLASSDLDALVSEGLDSEAVAYYKKYYGQVEGGSEFASELVKEHVKAHLEDELNTYKVKMARAYELAYDMVDRGLCAGDKYAVASQVDEIMKFNDESFDSLKRVVAKHTPVLRKEAGRMPQVGMIGSGEINVSHTGEDDWSQLSAAFSKNSKRMF